MRTPESVIKLLYDLYVNNEWEELEEYFLIAEPLILLHGGHFRIWQDIVHDLDYSHPLHKYSDSDEAWREQINDIITNKGCSYYNIFEGICTSFIYFNK